MNILARNQYSATVRSALQQMMQDPEILNGTGAAKFTRQDKKTVGTIYFKNGLVYSASINIYVPNIMTRLVQSGSLDQEGLKIVERKFGDDLTNPAIPEYILDNHLVPEKTMDQINQDFFLEIFESMIDWGNVNADWRANETTDFLKINQFPLEKIIGLVDSRKTFIDGVAEQFGVDLLHMGKITYRATRESDFDDTTPMIFHQIASIANGEWDISSTATNFGLTHFRVVQAVYELWKQGYLTLFYETYPLQPYPQESEEPMSEEHPQHQAAQTDQPVASEAPVVTPDAPSTGEVEMVDIEQPQSYYEDFIEPVFESDEPEIVPDSAYVKEVAPVDVTPRYNEEYESPLLAKLYAEPEPTSDIPTLTPEVEEEVDETFVLEEVEPDSESEEIVEDDSSEPYFGSQLTPEELTEPAYKAAERNENSETAEQADDTLDMILARLSQELETRRTAIAAAEQELSLRQQEYAALGDEITNRINDLSKAQDEYEAIVKRLDSLR